ncbi:hypothetical protein OH720_19210 [Pseudomonas sp. WJP1]|uniref:hypothetical protein n=1 Tax=Pseudomonas sp. WJP1 TaxID=2986947 RepID=UPI00234A64F4|nr:hypothetical protein [Pseudomonas sp. WJP1]WCM49127.1 hypothetical protein OH720_19210 [Pseudomonas sp. WJP1]
MADQSPPAASGTDKERFDQCIAMLKAYYDAIEARLAQNITAYLAALGWLLTSSQARSTLGDFKAFSLIIMVVALVFTMYTLNIYHYLKRWREIRNTLMALDYLEREYFARYELPKYAFYTYMAPVFVLLVFLVVLLFWVHFGFIGAADLPLPTVGHPPR